MPYRALPLPKVHLGFKISFEIQNFMILQKYFKPSKNRWLKHLNLLFPW